MEYPIGCCNESTGCSRYRRRRRNGKVVSSAQPPGICPPTCHSRKRLRSGVPPGPWPPTDAHVGRPREPTRGRNFFPGSQTCHT
ncbi:hypothetical protein H6P81_002241 [Aristolochia fimbriata]|uniref:Uncharacterized protein n=1 Tax=Aristolochia fimbriata TaxID=158543 RepID=A0AAV7F9H1_ARIFI|nr:hypothetical protein H6P81_002241 [Aristolochia fimbriata]